MGGMERGGMRPGRTRQQGNFHARFGRRFRERRERRFSLPSVPSSRSLFSFLFLRSLENSFPSSLLSREIRPVRAISMQQRVCYFLPVCYSEAARRTASRQIATPLRVSSFTESAARNNVCSSPEQLHASHSTQSHLDTAISKNLPSSQQLMMIHR